jgi:serine/threonine-protein kinase
LVPKISDFGLAKDLTRGPGQTQTGAIVGTPAYMAPEQAAGQGGQVGPPADIHALGAILYECLTGRPPFQGATVLETVEQVRTQEPVPPGRLQPKVPRDLETVCLKCLRKEPQKRYASAQELAADLRRFLAGEPIQARPVSRPERAWRWARRRAAAAGRQARSGLAVAAFVAGLWWHTTRLSAQVQKARQQQDRADTNYRQARRAINQMLDRLNQFQAPGVPQIETLRRDLSQDALTFFEGIAGAEADADPATRLDFARAYLLMGKLLSGQGQPEVRRAKLERARRLLEQLAAEDPANRDYQIGLADCLEELAKGAGGEECLRFREEALAVSQELCRLEPDNARWQRAVAVSHLNLGCCYADQPQRAEAHWKEAVRLQEKIARASGQPWDRYWLAVSSSNLAMLYRDAGRVAEADATYREVEPRLSELVREQPDNKEWAYGLVQTLRNWGAMLNTAGRGEEARERLTRGVEIMEKELTEDPQNPGVQDLLLGCLVADMNNCTLRQRPEEGEKDWKRALDLSARLNSWDDLCIGALWDARFGAHALAAARAEHLAGQKGISHEALYTLAKAYAVAAAAAQKDSRLPLAERGPAAERYAAAAMALLAGLGREGYFTTAERRTLLSKGDADLEPLRSRLDFQKLLADQEVLSSARK